MTKRSKSKLARCNTCIAKKKTIAKRERNDGQNEAYRWLDMAYLIYKLWTMSESLVNYLKDNLI